MLIQMASWLTSFEHRASARAFLATEPRSMFSPFNSVPVHFDLHRILSVASREDPDRCDEKLESNQRTFSCDKQSMARRLSWSWAIVACRWYKRTRIDCNARWIGDGSVKNLWGKQLAKPNCNCTGADNARAGASATWVDSDWWWVEVPLRKSSPTHASRAGRGFGSDLVILGTKKTKARVTSGVSHSSS